VFVEFHSDHLGALAGFCSALIVTFLVEKSNEKQAAIQLPIKRKFPGSGHQILSLAS
jgi:hypothetical protein